MGLFGGLFGSETIISVSTSFSRVFEDRMLPDSIKTGTIKGIFSEDGQLVENIMEDMVSCIGAKGERLYRYGRTAYPFGAPTSHVYKSASTLTTLQGLMSVIVGTPATMDYAQYAQLNRQHYGWQRLYDTYGYNPMSNELTVMSGQKGYPVYLEDMQVVLAQATVDTLTSSAFEQWGVAATSGYTPARPYTSANRSQTPYAIDADAVADYLKITVCWRGASGIQRETFTFPMMIPEDGAEFVQARFHYQVEDYRTTEMIPNEYGGYTPKETIHYKTLAQYFTYQVGSGYHEELDALFTSNFNDLGSFFPFGYLRWNKQQTSMDPTSSEYKAQKKLMGYLGLDYAQVNTAVNNNPGIDNVQSAMLMMIVPATSGNVHENRYLFDFFKRLYAQSGAVAIPDDTLNPISMEVRELYGSSTQLTRTTKIALVIQDARFSTTLALTGIYRKIVPGTIGAIGYCTSGGGSLSRSYSTEVTSVTANGIPYTERVTREFAEPAHFYRRQIAQGLYEEIQVTGLQVTYNVYGGHTTTNTMIPLDHSITEEYSIPVREQLYSRSLHYVFNAKQETTLKWYQQEWFSTVLIIIAIVWTIFSLGSDGGSALGAAIAAGTATAVDIAIAIAIMAIEYIAIKMIAKLFVKLLGPEFAMIVAVVAAAYGMYLGTTGTAGSLESLFAQDLLAVSNSMVSSVSAGYKKDLELLKKEGEEFNLFAKSKYNELEKIQEEMEGSRILSPFTLFGETPDAYYSRTVHAGNIGMQGISAITTYCDRALTLPTFEQTFGMV